MPSRDAAEKFVQQVKLAVDAGATLHTGGELTGEGAYFPPVVIAGIPVGSDSSYEEFFGPVDEIYKVSSDEEAIETANDSNHGLGGAVFSSDIPRAERVASRIETGMFHVNITQAGARNCPSAA